MKKTKNIGKEKCNNINIALVGNPNSGKTTLLTMLLIRTKR